MSLFKVILTLSLGLLIPLPVKVWMPGNLLASNSGITGVSTISNAIKSPKGVGKFKMIVT